MQDLGVLGGGRCNRLGNLNTPSGSHGVEYSTQLLWREHSTVEVEQAGDHRDGGGDDGGDDGGASDSTRTLAVNVTATNGARVMLGSASRPLPHQTHYELVLGVTARQSLLLVHGSAHNRGAKPPGPPASAQPLFEQGTLQLLLRWRLTRFGVNQAVGLLEVLALPAGQREPIRLFRYSTHKPIQLETFSFGSTNNGDLKFRVCSSSDNGYPERPDSGLGVPGCRSLLVHVQSSHEHVHNLAMSWSDMVDHHGRLQFWARASTDVEVVAGARPGMTRGDDVYHVVLGGDFNTKSWAQDRRQRSRLAETDTPALLSAAEFRPLWVSTSHGELRAGSGDLGHAAAAANRTRVILSWQYSHAHAPKFVTFATYRQRAVHILVDCARSPSLSASASASASDMLAAVRVAVASSSLSFSSPHPHPHSAPTFALALDRLAMHNGSLVATGTFLQEWQHVLRIGMKWNPDWFQGVQKVQYWLTDINEFPEGSAVIPRLTDQRSNNSHRVRLDPGPLEVNSNKRMSWNFHLNLKMPCAENVGLESFSCSISLELNSRFNNCKIETSTHLDKKWNVHWDIYPSEDKIGTCIIHCKVTSHHGEDSFILPPLPHTQQRQHKGLLHWMCTISILAALVTILLGYNPLSNHMYILVASINLIIQRRFNQSYYKTEDLDEKVCMVKYDGESAQITELNTVNSHLESAENDEALTETASNQDFFILKHVKLTVALILTSLFLSVIDLISRSYN